MVVTERKKNVYHLHPGHRASLPTSVRYVCSEVFPALKCAHKHSRCWPPRSDCIDGFSSGTCFLWPGSIFEFQICSPHLNTQTTFTFPQLTSVCLDSWLIHTSSPSRATNGTCFWFLTHTCGRAPMSYSGTRCSLETQGSGQCMVRTCSGVGQVCCGIKALGISPTWHELGNLRQAAWLLCACSESFLQKQLASGGVQRCKGWKDVVTQSPWYPARGKSKGFHSGDPPQSLRPGPSSVWVLTQGLTLHEHQPSSLSKGEKEPFGPMSQCPVGLQWEPTGRAEAGDRNSAHPEQPSLP